GRVLPTAPGARRQTDAHTTRPRVQEPARPEKNCSCRPASLILGADIPQSAAPCRGVPMRKTSLLLLVGVLAGPAPADEAAQARLVVKPAAFPTLATPMCPHCRDEAKRRAGELRDDDRVLCWTRGYSDGGAIPYRFFLNPYRVISDTYGVF